MRCKHCYKHITCPNWYGVWRDDGGGRACYISPTGEHTP